MSEREILMIRTREKRDGKWHTIDRSSDPDIHITFDFGPDDQRPSPDAKFYFLPFYVAQMLGGGYDSVYTHHYYCGSCFKLMGQCHEVKKFCPQCGAGIGHGQTDELKFHPGPFGVGPTMPEDLRDTGLIAHLIGAVHV